MAPRKSAQNGKRDKPNFASVTTVPCTCKYLERASEEPDNPIFFNAEVNEYHFRSVGKSRGTWMIYHCPWCGGAAPRSKRGSLFATITQKEEERLRRLTTGLRTIEAVIKKFGKPDFDMADGKVIKTQESKGKPPTIKSYRTLHYTGLSKSADVHVTDYCPDGPLRVILQGKYLGRGKK
jgi:hypothetical protein